MSELLKSVGTIELPATGESFKVSELFKKDVSDNARVKIWGVGGNFLSWFGDMVVASDSGSVVSYSALTRNAYDRDIIAALGGEAKCEITLAEMWQLMLLQRTGGDGVLLKHGYANVFYVRDSAAVLRAVSVYWRDFGWYVDARELGYDRWSFGRRVFVRNS